MTGRSAVKVELNELSKSVRAVLRCLASNKESRESIQRALLLLCELQDLLCRLQDQLTCAEENWVVEPPSLFDLNEVLDSFESTLETIEISLQPGGVSARMFRKRLLEKTFIPRLEQFKAAMILASQLQVKYVPSIDFTL